MILKLKERKSRKTFLQARMPFLFWKPVGSNLNFSLWVRFGACLTANRSRGDHPRAIVPGRDRFQYIWLYSAKLIDY